MKHNETREQQLRNAPELDRGCDVYTIRSYLFPEAKNYGLPVMYAYFYSTEVDVASALERDPESDTYHVSSYIRVTDTDGCYRALVNFYETILFLERKNNIPRLIDTPKFFNEINPDHIKEYKEAMNSAPCAGPSSTRRNPNDRTALG